jgi:small-conductance mechanosensitive channel
MIRWVVLGLALALFGAPAARAQSAGGAPAVRADHQAEDLGRLLDLARERGQEVVIRLEPSAGAAAKAPRAARLEASLLGGWDAAVDVFIAGVDKGIEGMRVLPALPDQFAHAWSARRNGASDLDALARIVAVLGGGLLVGWLARRLIAALLPRASLPPGRFIGRLGDTLRGTVADAAALAAFAVVASCMLPVLLAEPDLARFIARDLIYSGAVFGYYWLSVRFLLSPGRFTARLLPIRHPEWHYCMVLLYAICAVTIYGTVGLVTEVGDARAVSGWFLIVSTLVLAYKIGWFWAARVDFAALVTDHAGQPPSLAARFAGGLAVWLLIVVGVLNWATGRFAAVMSEGIWWGIAAGVTQVAVALLPITAAGAALVVAEVLGAGDDAASPLRKATIAVGRALAGGGVWIVGLIGLAELWGVNLLTPAPGVAQMAWRLVVTVGVAIVTGWTLWRFASAYLAEHAPKPRSLVPGIEEDEGEGGATAQSRLATALPLVRSVILGVVVGVTALVVLSALGIDIGPLLAGFGVIGLAISFGSQALVRDIVSGVFFMADDAFRVGEYIDTGRLKGTVEKITIRSVRLRHQNGLVHTIPFGQLQAITNASRDWATVKFNIRLERGVDLEQARKNIKRVGEAMLEDAELAAEIILPLKLQGVADITEGAIVCRLKITTKPARASWVQREALKRVYAALEADGIAFATGTVTVKAHDADRAVPTPAAGAVVALRPSGEAAS